MFKSLVRLRDSRPFLLTPKNEGPTWGGLCVKKYGSATLPPEGVRLFFLFPIGLQYFVSCVGYVCFGGRLGITSVCRPPVATPWIRKVLALEVDGEYLLAVI